MAGYSPVEMRNLKPSRKCVLYVNGDEKFPGTTHFISNRIRTFDGVKDDITITISGQSKKSGCVRNLFTPNGSRVRSLDDIQHGGHYVAATNDKFERLRYSEIPDRLRQVQAQSRRHKGLQKIDYNRIYKVVSHAHDKRHRDISAQYMKRNKQQVGLRVKVTKNNHETMPAHEVLIPSNKRSKLGDMMDVIQDMMESRQITKLYKIINCGVRVENFQEVTEETINDLENETHILAVEGKEELKVKLYDPRGKHNFSINTSPRNGPFNVPNRPAFLGNRYHKLSSIPSSKQSQATTTSPFSNPPGSHGGKKGKRSNRAKEVDYDKDSGGVYRASNKEKNSRGAHQVNESKETRTEKPIDQMEAETVEEEEIHTNEKTTPIPAGTELNKQPSKETKQNADNAGQSKVKTEVKKGGKSGKDSNKVGVLPPIVQETGKKGDTGTKVRKGDMKDIKDGHVTETVEKYEENAREGAREDGPFVDEKELTPKDLKTDDVIVMSEREVTPVDLQSSDVEVNKPPLSTTPPQGKLSQGSGKIQERIDGDASPDAVDDRMQQNDLGNDHENENEIDHDESTEQGMHRIEESEDDSFNRYDQNRSGAMTKDPRSSTPHSRDEARRDREQKEHQAASKIQAGVKGYQARKKYNQLKESKRMEKDDDRARQEEEAQRQEEEARRLEEEAHQHDEEAHRREDEAHEREMQSQKKTMDEDEAATRIQASFRGHQTRKQMDANKQQVRESHAKHSVNEREIESATKIQSCYRGYRVRKEYNERKKQVKDTDINDNEKKDLEDEDITVKDSDKESVKDTKMSQDEAAVAIQAGFKGYKVRKDYTHKKAQKEQKKVENKTDNNKTEDAAAAQIQASYRGYKARKEYADKKMKKVEKQKQDKQEQEAATKIQASFRGYKTRKQISKKKEPQLPDQAPSPKVDDAEELNKAATKIQSGFRGHMARKGYKSKVIDEGIVETDFAQLPDSAVSRFSVRKDQFIQGSRGDVASKIQSAFRVYHAKKILEKGGNVYINDLKRTRVADENIIAAYKGFRTRKIEKENFQKKNAAAVKIQAFYKGYTVRKTKIYPIRAVNMLQASVRGYITRKLNNVRAASNLKVTSVTNAEHYASIIQALCKGFLTRHTVHMRKERSQTKPRSATSLQGPTITNVADESKDEVSYWKDTHIKMYSDKTLRRAASRIQSVIYAYKTRQVLKKLKSRKVESSKTNESDQDLGKSHSIIRIQSTFKGYLERKSMKDAGVANGKGESAEVIKTEKRDLENESESRHVLEMNENESIKRKDEDSLFRNDKEMPVLSSEKDIRPSPPKSTRPTSARPGSSRMKRQGSDMSSRKRPRSSKTTNGRPLSEESRSSSRHGSTSAQSGASGKVQSEETIRSSTRLSGTANSVVSDSLLSVSDIDKEQRHGSAKSYGTWKSSEKLKSSGGEVEREGESLREVEDDAGELSSIERNVNAVSQLQAAFRAYKLRREISELMSGGGELMDIKKIDRAVSALRKDFRLRSAKVRRLGSCQFEKERPVNSGQNWWENVEENDNTMDAQGKEDSQEHELERDIARTLGEGDYSMNESENNKNDTDMKVVNMYEESESISKFPEKSVKERKHRQSKDMIEAAYRGYRTRVTETQRSKRSVSRSETSRIRSAHSRTSAHSERSVFHVQMHSDIINERCTNLQAAFAGYQTRKVFISLTKIVEQNGQSNHDTSGHQLERMGSLSETDDFKLRHKTIAKIQATYDSYRIAHESRKGSRMTLKGTVSPNTFNRHMVLPPIQQHVQLLNEHPCRPKSGIASSCVKMFEVPEGKSKTQPDLYRRYGGSGDTKTLTNIEVYVKKKMAATVIQVYAKAYLTRQRLKIKSIKQKPKPSQFATEKSLGRTTPSSVGRRTPVSVTQKSSKVCFKTETPKENKESREQQHKKKEDYTMTEMVRVRTASIKLEAERRKVIAEQIRLKQQAQDREAAEKKENIKTVKVDTLSKSDSSECLSPIPSSRLLTERSHQAKDLLSREERAAVQIQKVYRGHAVRQKLDQTIETRKQLDQEYSDWKTERKDAAVTIQSAWRGHSLRKESSDEEASSEDKDKKAKDDFSHLDGLLVINIGRTKSEIERANRKHDNASMIQMVFRACKMRRKLAIKGAKRRQEKNKAASKVQALYKGHLTRHKLKESISATRIQSVFNAYLARDNIQERMRVEEEQRQKASSLLQAVYLSFRKRRENEALKKERRLNQATENVQTAGKGFIVRWENARRRESDQMRAALQIQSSFKGLRERKRMKVLGEAVISIVAGFKSYLARQVVKALKDKREREKTAASRLQAAYRAYLVRKSNQEYREKMARQKNAATKIQCSFKGRAFRINYRIQKEMMERKKLASALKIQSVYRGHKGRKIARREMMEKKRQSAALKIQSVYRGHQERKIARKERHILDIHNIAEDMMNLVITRTFDYVKRRADSSERIQATVKGYNTRRQMTCKLTDEAKYRMHCASVIQAAFRAKTDRKRTDRKSQRDISATIIQSVFRAKEVRKKQDNKVLLQLMNESATKIQSLYRGYMTRTEIQKEREMIANLEPPPTALISARTRSGKLFSISVDEVLMKNSRAIILFHRKATDLQEAFRAYITRKEMKDRLIRKTTVAKRTPRRVLSVSKKLTKEDKAAILIQKTFRGYWIRKLYMNAMAKRRKLRSSAATNLQAAVKGYRTRLEESGREMRLKEEGVSEVWRQKQEAANIISLAYRSFQHRKAKRALRVEM